jgi:DNA primase
MDAIVIVEGRADVLNLLKNDVQNVVAVGGANVTNAIAKLAREKEVTVFLDGDRGGDIILNELARVADIDFVARAPVGKEVEELSRKELIKCLRAKVPYETATPISGNSEEKKYSYGARDRDRSSRSGSRFEDRRHPRRDDRQDVMPPEPAQTAPPQQASVQQPDIAPPSPQMEATVPEAPAVQKPSEVPSALLSSLDELENTLRARKFARQLRGRYGLPVFEVDERYSTTEAKSQAATDADAASACIILEQFLRSLT